MTPPFFIHEKRGDFSTNREARQTYLTMRTKPCKSLFKNIAGWRPEPDQTLVIRRVKGTGKN
jgi:hypothetical protein